MRVLRRTLAWGVLVALATSATVCVGQSSHSWPPEMLDDAALNDVTFINATQGWAVGDRGVVLATEDGGRTWRLQKTPVTCRLESVCFLDSKQGWAVGGFATPYTHRSRGVVLRTVDGGAAWQSLPAAGQPWLRFVRMRDAHQGVAWGDSIALCPSGVTRTADRGRSWQPVFGAESNDWQAGDVWFDPRPESDGHGFLLGARRPMLLDGSRLRVGRPPDSQSHAPMRDAAWIDSRRAIAVGDRSGVWFSENGGRSWVDRTGGLPPGVVGQFDWRAVTSDGRRIWIAGHPGTSVLVSDDDGQHWRVSRTNQTLGLRDMCCRDNQLWAVGELGTVLHSPDQGRSWNVQRAGGRRAGLLAVFAHEKRVPWPLLAKIGARDGWRCVVAVDDRDVLPSDNASFQAAPSARRSAAVAAVGGAAAVTLRASQGQPSSDLVRLIREWRPDVVLTSPPGSEDSDRFRRSVFAAMESAADPNAMVDQILIADLHPWAVDSAAWACDRSEPQVWMTVPAGEIITTWGRVVDDVARSAASLMERTSARSRPTSYYTKRAVRLAKSTVDRASDSSGQGIRRSAPAASMDAAERLRRVVTNQRAVQLVRTQLKEVLEDNEMTDHIRRTRGIAVWGQLQSVIAQLDAQTTGALLWELAGEFRDAGQLSLAHQMFERISNDHTEHGVADAARQEMVRLQTSDEWRWRFRDVAPLGWPNLGPASSQPQLQVLSGPTPQGVVAAETLPSMGAPRRGQLSRPPHIEVDVGLKSSDDVERPRSLPPNPSVTPADQQIAPVAHAAPLDATKVSRQVPAADVPSRHLLRHVQGVDPTLASDPLLRLAVASQLRQDDHHDSSRQQYATVTKTGLPRHWRSIAATELWLAQPDGPMPAVAVSCRAGPRPHLDGHLSDPIWRKASTIHWPPDGGSTAGRPEVGQPVTSVKWARDERFLYLAISCRTDRPPPAGEVTARTRDPDLTGRDRVEISLDVDRDYLSSWRLAVDRLGRVVDACDESLDWDPQWYVAQDSVHWDREAEWQWTVEAAIAWDQLVPRLEVGDAWAMQIRRISPNEDASAWPLIPAGDQRSARWGLLLME